MGYTSLMFINHDDDVAVDDNDDQHVDVIEKQNVCYNIREVVRLVPTAYDGKNLFYKLVLSLKD